MTPARWPAQSSAQSSARLPAQSPAQSPARPSRVSGDRGSVLLLTIGFALVAAMLVLVAVDASAFFLARRSLSALADGAAVAGAEQVDLASVYRSGPGTTLPLADQVPGAVADYLGSAATGEQLATLACQATADGRTVTVHLTVRKRLPFLRVVSAVTGSYPDGTAEVSVTARARVPVE